MSNSKREAEAVPINHSSSHRGGNTRNQKVGKPSLAQSLSASIQHGASLLHAALKIARICERQKLGRRVKSASSSTSSSSPAAAAAAAASDSAAATTERLKNEVLALKGLDLAAVARGYLVKVLGRRKRVRECEVFGEVCGDGATKGRGGGGGGGNGWTAKSPHEANLVARLVKSSQLREVLPGVLDRIDQCLGLEDGQQSGNPTAATATATAATATATAATATATAAVAVAATGGDNEVGENDADADHDITMHTTDHEGAFKSPEEGDRDDEFSGFSDDAAGRGQKRWRHESTSEKPDDSDVDMAQFADRLASSSSSAQESNSDNEDDGPLPRSLHRSNAKTPSSAQQRRLPTTTTTTSTTFLPSLTLGGYISGSESDNSDGEPAASSSTNLHPSLSRSRSPKCSSGPPTALQRNNRRGQRARQQIAEKKYGSGARHLHKQQQRNQRWNGEGRDSGWDTRRGAIGAPSSSSSSIRPATTATTTATATATRDGWKRQGERRTTKAARSDNNKTDKRDQQQQQQQQQQQPLHPSWEAARSRKIHIQRIQQQHSTGGNRKVVFD